MRFFFAGLAPLALLATLLLAQAPAVPRVTYSRSFKGSDPAFLEIEVDQDGRAVFQARENDADPLARLDFTASPVALREIFHDAASLHGFAGRPLQSKAKVAYTGDKLFAFDDAAHHQAQTFTYTQVPAAVDLESLFEKTANAGMDAIRLSRAMQYDHLEVLGVVERIGQDWDGGQLAETQLLTPLLARLVSTSALMEAARRRAQDLLQKMLPDS